MYEGEIRGAVALVLNGHHAVRRAVCDRIRASLPSFNVREAATLEDALCMLDDHSIDIVLIDGEGGGINGLKSTRAILQRAPKASVIVMSSFDDPACRVAASQAGALAFVSKRAIGSELMPALERLIGEVRPQPSGCG